MPGAVEFGGWVAGVDAVGREAVDGFGHVFDRAGGGCCRVVSWSLRIYSLLVVGFTVGELRTDIGWVKVGFYQVDEDGGVCEDQNDVR